MIFSADDLRHLVIRETLHYLDDWSQAAENLLVGTAIQESGLGFCLKEHCRLGIYHISPIAHRTVWDRYLVHHPELASQVRGLAGQHGFLENPDGELLSNLKYATAIAWCIYRKAGRLLPPADDIEGLAQIWQQHFHAKPWGRTGDFVRNYRDLGLQKECKSRTPSSPVEIDDLDTGRLDAGPIAGAPLDGKVMKIKQPGIGQLRQ